MHLAWSPQDETTFATVGKNHMMLCTVAGGGTSVTKKKGQAKSGTLVSQSSIAWSQDAAYKSTMFSGGADGKIYQWAGASAAKPLTNCKGAIHSIAAAMDGSE